MTEYRIFSKVEAAIKLTLIINANSEEEAEKLASEKILENLEIKNNNFKIDDITVESIKIMIDNQDESDLDEPE